VSRRSRAPVPSPTRRGIGCCRRALVPHGSTHAHNSQGDWSREEGAPEHWSRDGVDAHWFVEHQSSPCAAPGGGRREQGAMDGGRREQGAPEFAVRRASRREEGGGSREHLSSPCVVRHARRREEGAGSRRSSSCTARPRQEEGAGSER
jgi:hypothetical protein